MKLLSLCLFLFSTYVSGECHLRDIHSCWNLFDKLPNTVNTLCNHVNTFKQCISQVNCCDEYESVHCLKMMDHINMWHNHYGNFEGCDERVCSCKKKDKIDSTTIIDKNHRFIAMIVVYFIIVILLIFKYFF
jgi:hypothetical protein